MAHGTEILLTKGDSKICFDKITHTKDGLLCGVKMVPRMDDAEGERVNNSNTPAPEAGEEDNDTSRSGGLQSGESK